MFAMMLAHATAAAPASCDAAAQAAEAAWHLPPGLMAAIGRVEAGRWDAGTGRIVAWPWTVNAAGRDYYSASPEQAIALVRSLRAQGIGSIDVGCFQVNLFYHPDAFPDLAAAFDPMTNGDAAGHFLAELHGRSGDWQSAVRLYHSATPGEGEQYRQRVYVSLNGGAASAPSFGIPLFDAVVVLMSPEAARVRVFGPPGRDMSTAGATFRPGGTAAAFAPHMVRMPLPRAGSAGLP